MSQLPARRNSATKLNARNNRRRSSAALGQHKLHKQLFRNSLVSNAGSIQEGIEIGDENDDITNNIEQHSIGGDSHINDIVGDKHNDSKNDNSNDDDDDDDESVHSFSGDDTSTFFYAVKAKNIESVKTLLATHPSLVDADFGVDYRFDISSGKKHYTYTGDPDNGFCTAFHLAAECGSKELILHLHTLSNDYDIEDFRDKIPSEMAVGEAKEVREVSER